MEFKRYWGTTYYMENKVMVYNYGVYRCLYNGTIQVFNPRINRWVSLFKINNIKDCFLLTDNYIRKQLNYRKYY